MTSATAPVIPAHRLPKFAGKVRKYALSLTNPHKKKSSGQLL
jgi:hypothetical protein